jgi:hypothetical protein
VAYGLERDDKTHEPDMSRGDARSLYLDSSCAYQTLGEPVPSQGMRLVRLRRHTGLDASPWRAEESGVSASVVL